MGRWLNGILLWSWLALLAACIQIAPRSSVPFHAPLERHARYAAEVTLAIKEERRDAFSEAAANARLVLPQMPEIWGVDGGRPVPDVAPAASQVALLAPPPPNPRRQRTQAPLPASCAGLLARCERPFHVPQLAPTLLLPAAVMPAAAPALAGFARPASPHRFHLYFGLNSVELDVAARRVVQGALGSAMMVRPLRVIVAGHADRSGADGYNRVLSQRRAASVVAALIGAGMPAELIDTMALGESAPLILTDDGVAHLHNRRVEIILV
jgi:outer membrane protein OmpA-like peptidoglycan-associated protein